MKHIAYLKSSIERYTKGNNKYRSSTEVLLLSDNEQDESDNDIFTHPYISIGNRYNRKDSFE